MKRVLEFFVILMILTIAKNALAVSCTTLSSDSDGRILKEDCGASYGIKEYTYDGQTRYTVTKKTEDGNQVVREETHVSSKNNGKYSVQVAYKETTYDAQNNVKKVEDRYYTVTEKDDGTKASSLASAVVTSNTYKNGLLVSAFETNKVKNSSGNLVNDGTRNKITYTYDENQKLVSKESVLQISTGTNKWADSDPPKVVTNIYNSDGSYKEVKNGKTVGKYNADGTKYVAKRIYTVEEASKVVQKGRSNSFIITYR